MTKIRCSWAGDKKIYQNYHDHEWGIPVMGDDRYLFEMLCLEGAQAGLSWITVLQKRASYKKLFDNFDPQKVAQYSDAKLEKILENPGIIRNRLKVFSVRTNAQAFLEVQKEFGSFSDYFWGFVEGKPIGNKWKKMSDVPASTPLSGIIAKDLKRRDFKFVGTTIVYAYMQGVGMVNDHTTDCFCYKKAC